MIQQKISIWKRILPHVGAILCFLLLTVIYFNPVFDGKVLHQSDVSHFQGIAHELSEYYEEEGVASVWTGSSFSGMPSYQIGVWGSNPNLLDYIEKPFRAVGGNVAGPIFTAMVMAYILFLIMGLGVIPAMIGAIAYSISSYNIIIIEAGHVTKAWALAYLPLVVAGMIATFRKKYLLGGLLVALGIALQIKNNHLQVTYYTGLLCIIMYLGLIVKTIQEKNYKGLGKATGILAIAVALGFLCNASTLYSNYEMARESTRGTSELSAISESEKQSTGLDKDYAFAWSYGKAETLSLLIPDIHGGASGGTLGTSSDLYKAMQANGIQVGSDGVQSYTYWGDQPFTSGPVYFGAIVCFLFVLGMIIIKSRLKWIFFIATIIFIFLSWGRNFELFNDWFFYYFPYYNKFRAVSMALVIPSITMVVIAIWGVTEFLNKNLAVDKLRKALYWSAGVTGGICLFFWLLPSFFFNFTSPNDVQFQSQLPGWYYQALLEGRKGLLTSDAFRSLIFILLSAAVLWFSLRADKMKHISLISGAILLVLVTVDLWNVDRRYLNDKNFQNKISYNNNLFSATNANKAILEDKSPSYRVLNLNNPFQDSHTSYFHKSIGGYHAAKLKRYQELIEYHLQGEINQIIGSFNTQDIDSITASFANLPALNMLNAKYIIFNPDYAPLMNPYALGNAWFVNEYRLVENADQEIEAIYSLNPSETAIIDKRFEGNISGLSIQPDSTATIAMTVYKPDRVVYKSNANSEQLAMFSEIYYANGWEAYIDGQPAPHFRADWTLRAMRIPAGQHEIEFKFVPHDYYTSRTVTSISSGLLILLLLGSIGWSIMRERKNLAVKD